MSRFNGSVDQTTLFKLGYGLYAVTCREGDKDNAAIVNTVMQVTQVPLRVAVSISKESYTCQVVERTGIMNVNVLSVDTPFSVFEKYGFQSGRDVDKFAEGAPERSSNGLAVISEFSNAFLSLKVERTVDLESHIMFICSITEASLLSESDSMTYDYYHKNVKPKPQPAAKKGYVCKICNYVYEGEELPEDFVCPICKHGAADFEPLA